MAPPLDREGLVSRIKTRLNSPEYLQNIQNIDQIDRVRQNILLGTVGTKNEGMVHHAQMLQASLERLLKKLRHIHKQLTDAAWTYFLTQRNLAKLESTAPRKPDDEDKKPTEVVPDKAKPKPKSKPKPKKT